MRQKITPEASSRICSHMNEDHGLTVYGLVLSTMSKAESDMLDISKWTMKSISLSEMNLSFVVCDKKSGTCEPREISIPFVPQLRSGSEVRPRVVKLHSELLAPKLSWLISDGLNFLLLMTLCILGYYNFAGREVFKGDIENFIPESFKEKVSIESTFLFVQNVFHISVIAHFAEAVYVGYLCRQKLKLGLLTTLKWTIMVLIVGFPMTNKVVELDIIQRTVKSKEN